MEALRPETPDQLAESLITAASAGRTITLGGAFSKNGMAGPVKPSDVTISTTGLNRILQYEPRDLTISVEAGIRYEDLARALEENGQILPLDPPFSSEATIGGILAANTCGSLRRLYGTARDLLIGMKFATLEGKLVQSGGMVVKNVAGLDMGKLLIGSFGTLAAIAVANFKLVPKPPCSGTFLLEFEDVAQAMETRDRILHSVLQPTALDLLNAAAAEQLGREGCLIALQAGGNAAVMERYRRELGAARAQDEGEEANFWTGVREFTPHFLKRNPEGVIVRASCTLAQVREVMESFTGPAVARAASGVCYGYFSENGAASEWMERATVNGWRPVIEFAPESKKTGLDLWPGPGSDFDTMKKVKGMFDPGNLLNRGRLYGRL
ncbi:MAG TPA: FAD-binding oxidoreductase [Bryobacteraceae bacterium]|nr:FAD-binding oxidoreductase [Bryobacteraceae bacterium]